MSVSLIINHTKNNMYEKNNGSDPNGDESKDNFSLLDKVKIIIFIMFVFYVFAIPIYFISGTAKSDFQKFDAAQEQARKDQAVADEARYAEIRAAQQKNDEDRAKLENDARVIHPIKTIGQSSSTEGRAYMIMPIGYGYINQKAVYTMYEDLGDGHFTRLDIPADGIIIIESDTEKPAYLKCPARSRFCISSIIVPKGTVPEKFQL